MKIIAYDLGTGGVKASLYDEKLNTLAKAFFEYKTYYPSQNQHEQKPSEWWECIIQSTRALMQKALVSPDEVKCLSLSGHSLVAVPIDDKGNDLSDCVPIWSDTRAAREVREFFTAVNPDDWYLATGNGFPAACYPIFKLMWLRKHSPEVFCRIYKVLGSKDYINYRMTGMIYTDYSYASGTGAYNLKKRALEPAYLQAAGLPEHLFPDIIPSHSITGHLTADAAEKLGLMPGVPVTCGGVDNSCMALGAVGHEEGKVYVSLGSSSWIPVNSKEPVLDLKKKPYVFAHIEEKMFTSAFSIFSGGNSYRWAKDTLCHDFKDQENAYDLMCREASLAPPGANGILFNPSLAGGTSQDKSTNIRGAYLGLHLGTKREDMLRAALEGITLNLKCSYDFMKEHTYLENELLICGGGSKSPFWLQLFADIFNVRIRKTNIDQDAASLGAAAIAARAVGIWQDYSPILNLHHVESEYKPDEQNVSFYQSMLPLFKHAADVLSELGDYMHSAF